jgi:hypothetical protein
MACPWCWFIAGGAVAGVAVADALDLANRIASIKFAWPDDSSRLNPAIGHQTGIFKYIPNGY